MFFFSFRSYLWKVSYYASPTQDILVSSSRESQGEIKNILHAVLNVTRYVKSIFGI